MQKTKTVVKIGGREYTMLASEPEEYIHRVAIFVNRKLEEITKSQPSLSTTQAALLTAINLGDEVLKLKDSLSGLQNEVSELKKINKKQSSPALYDVSKRNSR